MKLLSLPLLFLSTLACLAEIIMPEAPLYILGDKGMLTKTAVTTVQTKSSNAPKLIAPADNAVVPLISDAQKEFIKMDMKVRRSYFADNEKREQMKNAGYYQLPVTLQWEGNAENEFTVIISEKPSLVPGVSFAVKGTNLEIENLKIAQKYYWSVNGSQANSFTTEDMTPRFFRITGVPNVRDLGGYIGMDGRRTKQGIAFRTSGLNSNAKKKYEKLETIPPERQASIDKRKELIKKFTEEVKNGSKGEYLPYCISNDWKTFSFEGKSFADIDIAPFLKMDSIPNEYLGVKMIPRKRHSPNNSLRLSNKAQQGWAGLICQEFESDKDGFIQVTSDAIDLWTCYANGEKIFEIDFPELRDSTSVRYSNYRYDIPVKAGKNILVYAVTSGENGWKTYCAKPQNNTTRKDMLKKRIAEENNFIELLNSKYVGMKPGISRFDETFKRYIIEDLAWKSDIDLRSNIECFGMTGSPLGDAVKWFHISHSSYGGMATDNGKAQFKNVFEVLLDENNYPLCLHCIGGQDRTGAVSYIINGLLGVEDNFLYLDWELSGFTNSSLSFKHATRFDGLVKVFLPLPGNNTREKLENYVLGLGFTQEDIAKFRKIWLE